MLHALVMILIGLDSNDQLDVVEYTFIIKKILSHPLPKIHWSIDTTRVGDIYMRGKYLMYTR